MSFPSGDQCGDPVYRMPNELSCTAFEPSASQIQTSWLPDRFDSKAICFPSGEIFGAHCSRDELTTSRAGAAGFARSTRQMFILSRAWTKASRLRDVFTAKSRTSWTTGSFSAWPGRASTTSHRSPPLLKTMRRLSRDHASSDTISPSIPRNTCVTLPSLSRCRRIEPPLSPSVQLQARESPRGEKAGVRAELQPVLTRAFSMESKEITNKAVVND